MIEMEKAVETAFDKFFLLYGDPRTKVDSPLLEEIRLSEDKKSWEITIGFNTTEFDVPSALDMMLVKQSQLAAVLEKRTKIRRKYKLFTINGDDGALTSMTMKDALMDIAAFLHSGRDKGLILDANVLLLLILGGINPAWIAKFERTRNYQISDYEALNNAVKSFVQFFRAGFASTPNILTEVSNLANKMTGEMRERFYEEFSQVIANLHCEEYINSGMVSQSDRFADFGLTDLGIAHIAEDRYLVISTDGSLVSYLRKLKMNAFTLDDLKLLG